MAKQYLLIIEESYVNVFKACMPGLCFLEVEGLGLDDKPNLRLLTTPYNPPLSEPVITEQVISESTEDVTVSE